MIDLKRAEESIKRAGFRVEAGPFYNDNYFNIHGKHMVRIRTTLSRAELERMGVGVQGAAAKQRSVRFLVDPEDGYRVQHITASERKKRSKESRKRRRSG